MQRNPCVVFIWAHIHDGILDANTLAGFEEEEARSPENYPADNYRDEQYTPSPPHASGGSYYPGQPVFPPPPTGTYAQELPFDPNAPIPPYNPADYAAPQQMHDPQMYDQQMHDQHGYPAPRGDNVSANVPLQYPAEPPASAYAAAASTPYFPPPPSAPRSRSSSPPHGRGLDAGRHKDDEGALDSSYVSFLVLIILLKSFTNTIKIV